MNSYDWTETAKAALQLVVIPLTGVQIKQYVDVQILKKENEDRKKEAQLLPSLSERLVRIETLLEALIKKVDGPH